MENKLQIKEIENGNRIAIYTPYNEQFVRAIKMIGGAHFDWDEKCWTVSSRYIDDIRDIMMDIYGETDQEGATETVDVKIVFTDECEKDMRIEFAGKTLAFVRGRDSGAWCGDDVCLVKGEIKSGGSNKYPDAKIAKGSEFKVYNIVKSRFDKAMKELDEMDDRDDIRRGFPAEITILDDKIDKEALQAEKEKLLARIAEIDKILEETED